MSHEPTIEIKNDFRAHLTGNAFIEIISNDQSGRMGGFVTSTADWLIYHVYFSRQLTLVKMDLLQSMIPTWKAQYRTAQAPNKEFNTIGLLVPLSVLKSLAFNTYDLTHYWSTQP